jgi:hypothetical protein
MALVVESIFRVLKRISEETKLQVHMFLELLPCLARFEATKFFLSTIKLE